MRIRLSISLLTLSLAAAAAAQPLAIRILYDNTSARPDLSADWGFAALVTFHGQRVLLDSGTKPDLFLDNLQKLQIDPASIQQAIISHEHRDHRGGMYRLYPLNPAMRVYFLDAFPREAYREAQAIGMRPERVTGPFDLMPGMHSTGMIAGNPPEQSLAIDTPEGIVLLTGCCHPGVVKIVETVEKQRGANAIRLLIGGFHIYQKSAQQIDATIAQLQRLHVQRVVPAHCTGDLAKQHFQKAYGASFDTAGAGKRIVLP
jgi:7,8-dihydropterin-6-yl-methyl-4-(beta-D-ribofuranosyl)aminobenzene 5'-phosphate synthase